VNFWKGCRSLYLIELLLSWMQGDGIQSIDFFSFIISYIAFLISIVCLNIFVRHTGRLSLLLANKDL